MNKQARIDAINKRIAAIERQARSARLRLAELNASLSDERVTLEDELRALLCIGYKKEFTP